ncbi:translocation protein in type III secretion system, RhcU [Halomonas sp. MCCC 1A17488]|uniref:Flagellar biosynthetic protein FlhB n=1 Tax=Billgrantia sulfidoxydans TaxID=2733484 RepID=A0ABX7W4L6_9GAMM|nr:MULTISPECIES: EscU/YscU/HrcU family type III secretion system export apparatus switch protein [Halomonas]MCE8016447.1 translocation protein in type III secretion system, RhcU [Halomonas sp. MCCC 1A17488]MCG3239780.1 translocation protein in type III secretion system, RhcU [Halomonas sp. MCCC 1A17488]QPP50319.1 EscU/YscU/HrcU family type III secretion system export apparatus switch protein [Halomonas sp. SS10-MC5]QTP53938.1 translocation protein in type III secretion system, RhcU [Halomonas s
MSEKPSEERSLPPSEKKLRDARKKGQVSKSSDMVTAMVMLGGTLYLLMAADGIERRVRHLIGTITRLYHEPFDTLWPRLLALAAEIVVRSVLPIIVISVVAAVLTNVLIMRGPVFSVDPVKPRFERINPAEGLKRIFSARGLIEFAKSLFKMVALATAFVIVFRLSLQTLLDSPRCGFGCLEGVFMALLEPLIVTALVAFLVVGLIDVQMQRWLFRRDQRMTRTEHKRERKDLEGDPEIRRARQRERRDMYAHSARTGLENASLMLGAPGDWLVGLRYAKGETPVPVMVCKAAPEESAALFEAACTRGVAVANRPDLAARIARRTAKGGPIPQDTFQAVADELVAAGVI